MGHYDRITRIFFSCLCVLGLVIFGTSLPVSALTPGTIKIWGNRNGANATYTTIASPSDISAGEGFTAILRSNRSVTVVGENASLSSFENGWYFNIIAIAAGNNHLLMVWADGTVSAEGSNDQGQIDVPEDLSGVTAVAAGSFHSLALKSDGTVVQWGQTYSPRPTMPTVSQRVTAIAAGNDHSLALLADGTVVTWGENDAGQLDVPTGLTSVVAVAAGYKNSLALRSDGTLVAWGTNADGRSTIPAGLDNVVAIDSGGGHNIALKSDGTVVSWGWNAANQTIVPAGISGVTKISAGWNHSVACACRSLSFQSTWTPSVTLTASMTPTINLTRSKTFTRTKTPTKTRTRTMTKSPVPTATRNLEDPNQAILNGMFDKNVRLPYPKAYGWDCMTGGYNGSLPWRVADFCWMNMYGTAPLQPAAGKSAIMRQRIFIPRAYPMLKVTYAAINTGNPCWPDTSNAMIKVAGSVAWKMLLCSSTDTGYDRYGFPKQITKTIDLSRYKGTWQNLDVIVTQHDGYTLTFILTKLSFK